MELYGVPHGILRVFSTILYENEFQNPQIFQLSNRRVEGLGGAIRA
jgi:hypothetical protein